MVCAPAACGRCGAGLAGARVTGVQKLQEFDITPPPPPRVTEYQVQARACGRCGAVTAGQPPPGITGRAQYGPEAHAQAANLASAHYIPVGRAAQLMGEVTGPARFGGLDGRGTAQGGGQAGAVHGPGPGAAAPGRGALRRRDPRPRRRAPGIRPRRLHRVPDRACTPAAGPPPTSTPAACWTATAGSSSATATPAISHLTDALHAWCGAHNLRDLRDLYTFDPGGQVWARSMADLLIHANAAATAARAAGQPRLGDEQLAQISAWYRGAVAKGITDNQGKRSKTAKDGLRLARRFRDHQDMILRFATDLAVGFTSNQAERDVRPVKVQQRTSGGCWRTLDGLADFAIVQSYLSTAAKWGHQQTRRAPPALHNRTVAPARLHTAIASG